MFDVSSELCDGQCSDEKKPAEQSRKVKGFGTFCVRHISLYPKLFNTTLLNRKESRAHETSEWLRSGSLKLLCSKRVLP